MKDYGDSEKDQILLRVDEEGLEGLVSVFIQQTDHEGLTPAEAVEVLDDLIHQAQEARRCVGS